MIMQLPKATQQKQGVEMRSQLSSSIAMAESTGKRIGRLIPEGITLKHADILKVAKALKYTVSDRA